MHRGVLEPDGLPHAKHLHVDRAELRDHRSELAAFGPDAAIDCHALSRVDAEIALDALPRGIRLVVISSIDVYRAFGALHEDRETDPVPIDEDSPVRDHRYPYRGRLPDMDDYDKLDVEDVYLPAGATALRLPMVYGERDYQRRDGQWTRAKGFDTFAPLGPWLAVGLDPATLSVECRVNGRVRQSGHTSDLLFPVPFLVSFISRVVRFRSLVTISSTLLSRAAK